MSNVYSVKRIESSIGTALVGDLNFVRRLALAGSVVAGLLGAFAVRAQSQPAAPATFDVASVKSNNSSDPGMGFQVLPDRFTASNIPLQVLIAIAYDLPFQSDRISGGPNWVRSERFDIEAKMGMPAGITEKARLARARLMLQTLLAERFKLTLRRETRDVPVYAVSVAKDGPKLKKAKIEEKDCSTDAQGRSSCHVITGGMGRGLHSEAADVSDIALFVSNWTDRPVVDKTGLQGLFQIDTEGWAPMRPSVPRDDGGDPSAEDAAVADPARPTLFQIFSRLGLKMESQRAPIEVYSILSAEIPSAN